MFLLKTSNKFRVKLFIKEEKASIVKTFGSEINVLYHNSPVWHVLATTCKLPFGEVKSSYKCVNVLNLNDFTVVMQRNPEVMVQLVNIIFLFLNF